MVQLLPELRLVDEFGELDLAGPVDQLEDDFHLRRVPEYELAHQELVEIRIDQRTDDRVDLPVVIMDSRSDVYRRHGHFGNGTAGSRYKDDVCSIATPSSRISFIAAPKEPSRSIARQASSIKTTSKPNRAASTAE